MWNPNDYITYLDLRTRPSRDLVQRIPTSPLRIVDLGCGTGNSTGVCAQQWPTASIVGLDSSAEMIGAARSNYPSGKWVVKDIAEWVYETADMDHEIDLIFSSAALQWVNDHARLFPRLLTKLAPGGVFACQMPAYDAIPNRLMREMAASARWRSSFPNGRAEEWRSHSLDFYYAILARSAKWLDLWATDYLQIMSSVDEIVEWYKSTGLRPYLACIPDSEERRQFIEEYSSRLSALYPASEAGGLPFLFRRIFIIAGVA